MSKGAPHILTEQGAEFAVEHFGTKGMKWGVRKERAKSLRSAIAENEITRTTANGDVFTLSQRPPSKLDKTLAFASNTYTKQYRSQAYLDIKDKNGKTIGEANFWHKDKDTTYLNWISVENSARGKGYASAILKSAEELSRAAGKKKLMLDVPGNAPDARHIYEKMGFKVTKEPKSTKDVWGGLTTMEKDL